MQIHGCLFERSLSFVVMMTPGLSKDGCTNGIFGHFFALSRLNWAGDNLD